MQATASSRVKIYGKNSSECGYCNSHPQEKSKSYGVMSSINGMSAIDYERLMLIGWRRSGCYLYCSQMTKTCCVPYTIRLRVSSFKEDKKQRQIRRRVNRYLESRSVHADTIFPNATGLTESSIAEYLHKMEVTLESPSFTEEKFDLYRRYQVAIHKDAFEELTPDGFNRFLVESPLFDSSEIDEPVKSAPQLSTTTSLSSTMRYGSYHQLYRIGSCLVAVGVIDILPSGLSSVYMFYDPSEKHLALGKYTALREIDFCRENNLAYYYMGFYIHTCVKMRYKGDYQPSELLCPVSLKWFALSECIPVLNKSAFSPLDPSLRERDDMPPSAALSSDRCVQHNNTLATTVEKSPPLKYCRFSLPPETLNRVLERIPLDIGVGRVVCLKDVTTKGRAYLTPILTEWIENCGPVNAVKIVIDLT